MRLLTVILVMLLDVIPFGKAYLKPLQQRDSILVADQLEYGFQLDGVRNGTSISLPDFSQVSGDTLMLVRTWQLDTIKTTGRKKDAAKRLFDIRAHVVLAPFEEGEYHLPSIPVLRTDGEKSDTLVFEGLSMDVKTMPVDTASFVIHDIKGQMTYPITWEEVLPWIALVWILVVIAIVIACIVNIRAARVSSAGRPSDPAYIVALRQLDRYRGDKMWAPDKQKAFYSGITDTLKFYMDDRYGFDAPEMTTAELFDALKAEKSLDAELYSELKSLFEMADFVKFAKFTATDEDNAKALPLAVRFVTTTYQTETEDDI